MARSNKYSSLNFNDIYEKKISGTTNNHPNNHLFSASKSPSTSSSSYLSASRLTHGGMLVLSRPSPKPQPPTATPPLSPSPKQQPPSPLIPAPSTPPSPADSASVISLRPQGKTGSGGMNLSPSPSPSPSPFSSSSSPSSPAMEKEMGAANTMPKSDKFVPPHLRAGFVAKEVGSPPPVPEFTRARSGNQRPGSGHGYQYHGSPDNHRPGSGHGYQYHHHGSPNNKYMENGRVKQGGGYQYNHGSPDNYRPGSAQGPYPENGRPNYGGGYAVGESDLGYLNRPRSGGNRPNSSGW